MLFAASLVLICSSFRLKSYPNLAGNVGTKGANGGLEALSKQQNLDEPNKDITYQAMSRKIDPRFS
jgi:hypothetical protein